MVKNSMELYFLRHGKAVEPGTRGVPDDFSRRLTEQGIEEMEAEAAAMERLGVRTDAILTSPLLRAKETAEIVAKKLGLKKLLFISDLLGPGCDLSRLERLMNEHPASKSFMFVGHEPDLSSMVGELIGGNAGSVEFKKAGLVLVTVSHAARRGSGTLRWLLPPRILRHCGGVMASNDE